MTKKYLVESDEIVCREAEGQDGEPLVVVVLMRDNAAQEFILLSPDETRAVAAKLLNAADKAETIGGALFPGARLS